MPSLWVARIIIIEDNEKIREGFVAVVESSGRYNVISQYSNCEDAISHLQEDAPDVVLMDIGLPGMSGLEGTTRIKKRLPACIILIITVMEDSEKVFQSLCANGIAGRQYQPHRRTIKNETETFLKTKEVTK